MTKQHEQLDQIALLRDLWSEQDWRKIGSAWPLYVRLLLFEGGRMVTTYERLARSLSCSGRNAREWVRKLETSKILKRKSNGHGIEIELRGRHLAVAQAPEHPEPAALEPVHEPPSSQIAHTLPNEAEAFRKMRAACELTGSSMEVRLIIPVKTNAERTVSPE